MPIPARRGDFDGVALFAALDARREELGLGWPGVAREIWALSAELNSKREDHPIAPATITGLGRRGSTSCQHALFFLRWLDRTPESFVAGQGGAYGAPLPTAVDDRRLRWNLNGDSPPRPVPSLYEAMNARRRQESLTWDELARLLHYRSNQLSGLRSVRFAISMRLAMRIAQWLERPAADFVYAAGW
jgi:hypothetical protein